MVEQRGMLNNQLSKVPYLQLSEQDVIAQTASQSFDISVWQFLAAPLFGARVDIVPNTIAHDPQGLLAHVQAQGITVLESVPSLIQGMLAQERISLAGPALDAADGGGHAARAGAPMAAALPGYRPGQRLWPGGMLG
jgi:non-ribosomal peptide synthetase component F